MYRKRSRSKRQELLIRILVYAGMTLTVIVTVASIVFFVLMGYRLDQQDWSISRSALVQLGSTPNGATVTIDGRSIGSRTPTKQSLIAGVHDFRVTRDGYRDWTKSLALQAGTLTWLNNIRLIPSNLDSTAVRSLGPVGNVIAATDNRVILVQENKSKPEFRLIDINAIDDTPKSVELPSALYSSGSSHVFVPTSFDDSGRYVLIKHQYDTNKLEWLILDTQRASESINLSRLLQVSFSDIKFSGRGIASLYGISNGTLRNISATNETLSRVIVSGVESFSIFDHSFITYVGVDPQDAGKKVAGVYRSGDDSSTILREAVDKDASLSITTARYFNDVYIAIAEDKSVTVLKGDFPNPEAVNKDDSLEIVNQFELSFSVKELSFSGKGSYLVMRGHQAYARYEVEFRRLVETSVVLDKIRWFDDVNLWTIQNGIATIQEFDGANRQELVPVSAPLVLLSPDDRFLYTILEDNGTSRLEQTQLVL